MGVELNSLNSAQETYGGVAVLPTTMDQIPSGRSSPESAWSFTAEEEEQDQVDGDDQPESNSTSQGAAPEAHGTDRDPSSDLSRRAR